MEGISSVVPIVIMLTVASALTAGLSVDMTQGPAPGAIVSTPPAVVATGAQWERLGMVLDIGPAGAYDDGLATSPFVLKDGDVYRMWYRGYIVGANRNRILYATSTDGRNWTKGGVAIDILVPPYGFDSVAGQSVIKEGSTYTMWFSGGFWTGPHGMWAQIYSATSVDAVTWSIVGVALEVGPYGGWDGGNVHYPWVVKQADGTYLMYYSGWDGGNTNRIGLAASTDGITFTRVSSEPILDLGPAGSWDGVRVSFPSVRPGSPWTMMYSGDDSNTSRIGRATSPDGVHWTKDAGNPEFGPGPAGAWDDVATSGEALLVDGPDTYMYYTGADGEHARIGLAREIKEVVPVVGGTAKCVPRTINLRSHGRWITCHPEPDSPYTAADIAAVSVRLDSWLSPVLDGKYGWVWVWNATGGTFLKFDRQALSDRLAVGEHVFLLEGRFTDGAAFRLSSETIRVIG